MFWCIVTIRLRWGIRGRFNTQKMGPKGARKGPGRPAWSPWAGRPSPFRSPIDLGFLQHEVCVNPNLCFTKTTDRTAYIYPEATVKEGDRRDRRGRASRDEFQRSIRVRHKRKATPEASSSLGAAASWRTARDPSLAGDFVTMIDYASLSFMG